MSDEGGSSGGGPPFFIAFAVGVVLLISFSGSVGNNGSPFFETSSTTHATSTYETRDSVYVGRGSNSVFFDSAHRSTEPTEENLTDREIEERLARVFNNLNALKEELREAKVWGQRSPYEGKVLLGRGNVYTTDYEREYLTLYASGSNEDVINISGWLIESYVTDEGATIPFGSKTYTRGRVNKTHAILLEPSEQAFVVSGESPIGVSFHENKCTGYLTAYQDFYPSLRYSCPYPIDELRDKTNIKINDDRCYEYVETIRSCEMVDLDELFKKNIGTACLLFVENELSYDGCLAKHKSEPFFDDGRWYIYLGRKDDLWRKEREIIRLIDREGRTVDVVEY